ncbi:alpha/beta fold hydrolase [bacterium]|nr:alpha/beta fold hydrolase [bacterium]
MFKYLPGILGVIIVLGFIIFLFNETPFLYSETKEYQVSKPEEWAVSEVSPMFLTEPKKAGVILFLHSYKSSPNDFKKVAEAFLEKYNVVIPLYPGHGTKAKDFKKTYFAQWQACARDTYLDLRTKYDKVYICGLSMGGTIALTLAEEFNADLAPDGIITIAAPAFFNNVLGAGVLYDWRVYLVRFISWIIAEIDEIKPEVDEDGAEHFWYQGKNYCKQVYSLKMGMYQARKRLLQIKAPILIMHSKGDKSALFENMAYIANKVSSQVIQTKEFDLTNWEHNRHLLTLYKTSQGEVIKAIEAFLVQIER